MTEKTMQIRNSTIDFLVFTKDAGEDSIKVRVQDGNVWLTQKAIAKLFDVDRSVVTKHLKSIFESGELEENAVFAQTADDGKTYQYKHYALPAIIAVGKVTAEIAKAFAESEFEKYRILQDRTYESDFDRLLKESESAYIAKR